jgi:hypothetical protein
MKKASKVLIGVLSVGALIGTGFAAWTINKGYTKAEAPGFTPDVIVNNNSSFGKFIVTQVEEKNEAGEIVSPIKFDAPREVYNNGQKLPFDPGEEDLEVTYNLRAESDNGHPVDPYSLGAVNRHAYDGIATEYIPDVSISTKVVDAQKQEVSAEVLAEIKEYVALPEDVSERQMQIPYERWLAADKKETGYDHTLRFGWGSLTHGENPQLYFIKEENKVEGKDLSESFEAYINKLNEVVKTSGIQFVFTFEIGGVEIFEANTSLISIVEGLGADLHVTHEGKEVKDGDELEIGAVVNVSASALEGYENPVITFNGKVIEAGEVTIVKGANEFGVTATKVTEPVDEKYYVHVGEAKYELTLDNEEQYTATLPSVKAGDIVNVAHGDQLAPVGTFKPDTHETNNLILAEDGKTMLVRQSADNVNIYFKKDMTVWLGGYVVPVENPTYYLAGSFNGWAAASEDYILNEVEGVYHFELTIAAHETAQFKVVGSNKVWYGEETTADGSENFKWVNSENKEVKIDIAFYPEKNADGKYIVASLVQGETPVDPVLSTEYYLTGKINGEEKWYGTEGVALTDLVKMDAPLDEKNLAEKLELSLKKGDEIKGIIVDKEDDAVKSVIWRGVEPSEQNENGSNYVVPKDGKYNFYLTSTALYVTEAEETPVEEPKGSLANPYTCAEIAETFASLENEQFSETEVHLKGVVTMSSYDAEKDCYKIYISYGDENNPSKYIGCQQVVLGEGVSSYEEANALLGSTVTIRGYVEKYKNNFSIYPYNDSHPVLVKVDYKEASAVLPTLTASEIKVGRTSTLTVEDDVGRSVKNYSIVYSSGENFVSFDPETGEFTGLAVGSATFSVKVGELVSESLTITVIEATEVTESTEKVIFADSGYTNGEAVSTVTIGSVTLTFDKGTNNNAPKYYDTGKAIRCYGGNTIMFSGATIKKIVLTFSSGEDSNAISANKGTFETDTWTGEEDAVTLTIDGTKGHRRIAAIEITYLA